MHNVFELCPDPAALLAAFDDAVMATAVGPVTAQALREHGVRRVLEPSRARLGSMVHAGSPGSWPGGPGCSTSAACGGAGRAWP